MLETLCEVALLLAALVTLVYKLQAIEPVYDEQYKPVIPPGAVSAACVDFVIYVLLLYFAGALSFVDF